MTEDTTPRMCSRVGCPAKAAGAVRLNIPEDAQTVDLRKTIRMIFPVEMCAGHSAQLKPSEIVDEDFRTTFRRSMKARGQNWLPNFSRAWVDMVALDDPSYVEILDLHTQRRAAEAKAAHDAEMEREHHERELERLK